MRIVKMSLVTGMLLGANLYAIENVKVDGDAKLYYHTDDGKTATGTGGLFDKDSSAAQAALRLGITADLTEDISAGASLHALSTLGLEGNLVSNVWEAGAGAGTTSDYWFSEAWMATTMGKTSAKAGRQTLDTPLVFTETWSIVPNTFESILLINQDIEDTTLVGAWVGSTNSGGGAGIGGVVTAPSIINNDSRFNPLGGSGAYTMGVINNSWKPLTAQLWYYSVTSFASAIWAQADLDMEGILVGAQYATLDPSASGPGTDTGTAIALMVGYEMKDVVTVKLAYSSTNDKQNGVGRNLAGAQTKMYTELWWNYGRIGTANTDAILISAEGTVSDIELFASYGMIDHKTAGATDLNEFALTASKSYGPVDTSIVFINTDGKVLGAAADGNSDAQKMLQVYLTYNF
ncbi:hypothetical protein JHD50_12935 [Sulfurimonas sp. MAG313]|nr:hypothetical protein [Sulfurimonas sp. MAG313]MDF1882193.1 hypothetical protein [Sulfurimonas sp. MAG313]